MEPTLKDFYEFSKEQFLSLHQGLANLTYEVGGLTRRVGAVEERMENVEDRLDDMTIALDSALVQLVGHEKRVTRLERKAT